MSDEHTVSIAEEICCRRCGEIIHTHFDCPACDHANARTDVYGRVSERETLTCGECMAMFTITDYDYDSITIRPHHRSPHQ